MSAGGFDRQGSLIRQLQGALGSKRLSEVRTVTQVVGAGVVVVTCVLTGVGTVDGVIIVHVQPVSHWSFTANPNQVGIVVNNSGAAQSMTFNYVVLGH